MATITAELFDANVRVDRVIWLPGAIVDFESPTDAFRDFVEDDAAAPQAAPRDDRIYVFTPQATVIELPAGGTAVDFAYALHTDVGHRCRGARVDGAMVPLSTPLKNGQTVEITTVREGGPSLDWLNPELRFLASPRARAKVRAWFNARQHEQTVAKGRELVEKLLQREGRTAISLEELAGHGARGVSHVLSLLDPGTSEPAAFTAYGAHARTTLRFHDCLGPGEGLVPPEPEHVAAILDFGRGLDGAAHLLVHCHYGLSRSTAALLTLLAQAEPGTSAETLVARLHALREPAWPNARMIGFADAMLDRGGQLSELARALAVLHVVYRQVPPGKLTQRRTPGRRFERQEVDE